MLKILCFGDSITLGEKDIEQGGWADRLKKHYYQKFEYSQTQQISLYNLGVAGETTDGLLRRFAIEVAARSIKGQKLLILFAYGINDIVIHKGKNIVPERYYLRNLHHCITIAKELQANVLLLNMLPIAEFINSKTDQYGKLRLADDIKKYNRLMKNLSVEMNCEYLDLHTIFLQSSQDNLSADGLHPNSIGHQLLYQQIKQKLSDLSRCL